MELKSRTAVYAKYSFLKVIYHIKINDSQSKLYLAIRYKLFKPITLFRREVPQKPKTGHFMACLISIYLWIYCESTTNETSILSEFSVGNSGPHACTLPTGPSPPQPHLVSCRGSRVTKNDAVLSWIL